MRYWRERQSRQAIARTFVPEGMDGPGGKSGLHRAACRLTAGGQRSKRGLRKVPQKIYRPGDGVRVKRCGKSAPRPEQSGWQGKPHAEQDQIGEEERPAPFHFRV